MKSRLLEEQDIQHDILLIFSKAKCIAEHNSKKVPAYLMIETDNNVSPGKNYFRFVFISTVTYLGYEV